MKNLINLFLISSFIFCACPDVAPNSNYSFIEDDCGNCWLPYCYNQQTHSVSYDLTEDECNYIWVNPGDFGDPYYNSYCNSCPNGYTQDSCGNCWNSYCYTFFSAGVGDDPMHSVYYDLTENECNNLGYNYYIPGTPGDPYFNSNCSDASDDGGTTGGSGNSVDCDGDANGLGATDDCGVCHAQLCYNTVTHASMPADTCDGVNEMWASPDNPMNPYWNASCEDCDGVANGNAIVGDLNSTGIINVADVVYLVNFILGASNLDVSCGDINNDGSVDVSDVVALINIILSDRLLLNIDAVNSKLIISDNSLRLESDGFVQGIQLTLSHGSNFDIELVDAFVSEYRTNTNKTTLMIVTDGSHSITDIATFTGDVIINSVHVVNQSGDVFVDQVVELSSIKVSVVGPNPFNPSTQVSIVVPEAGFVSVNVYNILGEKVATLVDGYMNANSMGHVVNFNASHLASGVYLVQAVSAGDISTQKLMLIK
ncbi:MAG: hypothetical protein CMG14_01110 [Candidatus Marinimicrobia bacterium]|nr:hypothetical protein [Candidatus Neomarinimicrobiota bacterium]|tara:strand:- start:17803 stop:19251 length:1449 start_codon:yes stop_codon:yes gene_type:complete